MKHPSSAFGRGLTLIELLIVISILSILLIFSFGAWQNHIYKARDTHRKEDLHQLQTVWEDYYNDHNCYPPLGILDTCGGDQLKPYLDSIPCDPITKLPYYLQTSTCVEYRILSILSYKQDVAITKLNCQTSQNCGYDTAGQVGYNYGVSSNNTTVANPSIPWPSASPLYAASPTSVQPSGVPRGNYACDKSGICNDVGPNNCPYNFANPVTCQQYCDESPIYWCK